MENAISRKLMFVAALLFAVAIASVSSGVVAAQTEVNEEKVEICHATNSAVNPYIKLSVSQSAIDGDGQNDHSQHTGPIFDPLVHNQQNRGWGDIIPQVDGVTEGLNWPGGQTFLENDCNTPIVEGVALIQYEVACVEDTEGNSVSITFKNFGDQNGAVSLNDEEILVNVGDTVVRTVATKTNVKIEIDEEIKYNSVPACGEVLGEPSPPAVKQTPTGGVQAGLGAVSVAVSSLLGLGGSAGALGYGVLRLRKDQ